MICGQWPALGSIQMVLLLMARAKRPIYSFDPYALRREPLNISICKDYKCQEKRR